MAWGGLVAAGYWWFGVVNPAQTIKNFRIFRLMMFAVDVLLHQCSRCNDAEKEPGNIALYCPGSSLIIVVCIGWEFEMSTLTGPGAYAFERELLSLPFEI